MLGKGCDFWVCGRLWFYDIPRYSFRRTSLWTIQYNIHMWHRAREFSALLREGKPKVNKLDRVNYGFALLADRLRDYYSRLQVVATMKFKLTQPCTWLVKFITLSANPLIHGCTLFTQYTDCTMFTRNWATPANYAARIQHTLLALADLIRFLIRFQCPIAPPQEPPKDTSPSVVCPRLQFHFPTFCMM